MLTDTLTIEQLRRRNTVADIDEVRRRLTEQLGPLAGADPDVESAADVVAGWAAWSKLCWEPVDPPLLCIRGLAEGRAYELELLEMNASRMERHAAALRTLIAHVNTTHPRARRRAARKCASAEVAS